MTQNLKSSLNPPIGKSNLKLPDDEFIQAPYDRKLSTRSSRKSFFQNHRLNEEDTKKAIIDRFSRRRSNDHDTENIEVPAIDHSYLDYKINQAKKTKYRYGVQDTPPWSTCIIDGFQHCLLNIPVTILIPLIISNYLCVESTDPKVAGLVSTAFLAGGICTLLDTTLGSRLPVMIGSSYTFLPPIILVLTTNHACDRNVTTSILVVNNFGNSSIHNISDQSYYARVSEISAALFIGSIALLLVSIFGGMKYVMKFFGPVSMIPTMMVIGLETINLASYFSSNHWFTALLTCCVWWICSEHFLGKFKLPVIVWDNKELHIKRIYLFRQYKALQSVFSITIPWAVYTIFGPSHNHKHVEEISFTTFNIPRPFYFGTFIFERYAIAAIFGSIIILNLELIGEYIQCAKTCRVNPPPLHAMNRGLLATSIGCIIHACMGSLAAPTIHGVNISNLKASGNASRQVAGIIYIIFGLFGVVGQILTHIPLSIFGGLLFSSSSEIVASGLFYVDFMTLNLRRNSFVVGLALYASLSWPQEFSRYPVKLDNKVLEDLLNIYLQSPVFVACSVSFLLDNLLPDSISTEKRFFKRKVSGSSNIATFKGDVYDVPYLSNNRILKKLPIFSKTYLQFREFLYQESVYEDSIYGDTTDKVDSTVL